MYQAYDSVLCPYVRTDGRQHVVLNSSTTPSGVKGKTKTISYPKALVESNTGKRLLPNETIDHNDRNKLNDAQDNLIVRTRSEHSSLDARRVRVDSVNCSHCGRLFNLTEAQRKTRVRSDDSKSAGPFCSRQCTGKYGSSIRNGGEKIERQEVVKHYFFLEK